jgi:phosphoribosylanthranilate isomerase
MTVIKICGLRTIEHALAAVEAGADLLGFILAPARRQVTPSQVAAIAAAVRAAPGGRQVGLVGVFVDEAPAQMAAIAKECGLDALQLSGGEDARLLDELPARRTIIKAIRMSGDAAEQGWLRATAPRLLVDAHVPGAYGGAGVLADWDRAAVLARQRPIVLAGGLTPDNVAAAIGRVWPWGVDVSSGVESDGVKDSAKIRAFVAAARAADAEHHAKNRSE